MSKHPDSNETALALLRAFDRSEAWGIRMLSERVTSCPLCGAVNLTTMHRYLGEARHLIGHGYLSREPAGTSARLSLTRKGRHALHSGMPFWSASMTWALGVSTLAVDITGCVPTPPEQFRVLLMDAPAFTGLAQVRDLQTDIDRFVSCNPHAVPTPKISMPDSIDTTPEATGRVVTRP